MPSDPGSTTPPHPIRWPSTAKAAISLTIDNMGEAADIHRNVWPPHCPIGSHYSVTTVLPQFLAVLAKYDIHATYFVESYNLDVYPDAIETIVEAGHEIGWHAWQHEAWGALKDEEIERANFERSFKAIDQFQRSTDRSGGGGGGGGGNGDDSQKADVSYRGFRPPGGLIHGQRTLKLCIEYGLEYISPAGYNATIVPVVANANANAKGFGVEKRDIVILPFRWTTVDAYYYMPRFGGLRTLKGESSSDPQSEHVLVSKMLAQVDEAVEAGGYLSVLFHPFLNASPERLQAFETVVGHLAKLRDNGTIWLARCCDVQAWIREHPNGVSRELVLDESTW